LLRKIIALAAVLAATITRAADEMDDRQHDRHFHQNADDRESAAPDWKPKRAIAVATANSKKLLAPINAEGPATHHSTPNWRFSQ
jgi:hypothetical protein